MTALSDFGRLKEASFKKIFSKILCGMGGVVSIKGKKTAFGANDEFFPSDLSCLNEFLKGRPKTSLAPLAAVIDGGIDDIDPRPHGPIERFLIKKIGPLIRLA